MKRIATILLLGVLTFNWLGYRVFTTYFEKKFDTQLEAQLDREKYDETQLVSIKVPVSYLTYYNTSNIFERVDGQVEVGGTIYKYVKRRLFNDSLELLCIRNQAAMQLKKVETEFFKSLSDVQTNEQNKKADTNKDFSKHPSGTDYMLHDLVALCQPDLSIMKWSSFQSEDLFSSFSLTDEQPPDFIP